MAQPMNIVAVANSEGRTIYRPPSVFVEATNSYSVPKWHLFDGKTTDKESKQGRPYSLFTTNCGVALKAGGEWVTDKPVIPTALCRKCFGKPKQSKLKAQRDDPVSTENPTYPPSKDLPF